MHPVIRIVCYLILAIFLARANGAQLLFSALLLATLLAFFRPPQFVSRLGRALYRLKWLFLSIVVLYLWFTPESSLADGGAALQQGLMRIGVLVLLIWGVLYMLSGLSQGQLLGAVYFLLRPLGWLGLKPERLALRLALTLQAVVELQARAGTSAPAQPGATPWQRIAQTVAYWFDHVQQQAEHHTLQPHPLPAAMAPGRWQWFYPVLLMLTMLLLQFVHLSYLS
jgi:hypothetical protein